MLGTGCYCAEQINQSAVSPCDGKKKKRGSVAGRKLFERANGDEIIVCKVRTSLLYVTIF